MEKRNKYAPRFSLSLSPSPLFLSFSPLWLTQMRVCIWNYNTVDTKENHFVDEDRKMKAHERYYDDRLDSLETDMVSEMRPLTVDLRRNCRFTLGRFV